ncbi:MAG TPA: BamA/TamA family outer membrane protein [Bacteroidota bacterium]|nr:BamA/TamA family outer membrane protein [Bacteroidota bacterium]
MKRAYPHLIVLLLAFSSAFCEASSPTIAPTPSDSTSTQDEEQLQGFVPLPILYYTPETGIAGGASIMYLRRSSRSDTTSRPSSARLDLIYTQDKQFTGEFIGDLFLGNGLHHFTADIEYDRYPSRFFGVGADPPAGVDETYTSDFFRARLTELLALPSDFYVGAVYFYENRFLRDLAAGGVLATGSVFGTFGGVTSGPGITWNLDTRDNIFSTRNGAYYQFTSLFIRPFFGSDFNFTRTDIDLRRYIRLSEDQVLSFQALATLIDGNPPFHKMAELGGPYIMRGYYEGRYRDRDLVALQTEYRIRVLGRFGLVGFCGVGAVAHTPGSFAIPNTKPSYGVGVRYLFDPRESVTLRADMGFGENANGLYLNINEAF